MRILLCAGVPVNFSAVLHLRGCAFLFGRKSLGEIGKSVDLDIQKGYNVIMKITCTVVWAPDNGDERML